MSEVPDPLRRLNILSDGMRIAHETIYDLHRRLVDGDRATATSRGLLAESGEIVLQRVPAASVTVRLLAAQWHEQSVLDPTAAKETALQLENELAERKSVLRKLLEREKAISAELRALVADSR